MLGTLRRILVVFLALMGVTAVIQWLRRRRNRSHTGELGGTAAEAQDSARGFVGTARQRLESEITSRLAKVRAELDKLRTSGASSQFSEADRAHAVSDLLAQVRSAQDALNDLLSTSAGRWEELKGRVDRAVSELERHLERVRVRQVEPPEGKPPQ